MTKGKLSQTAIPDAIHASHEEMADWRQFHAKLERMRDTGWIFAALRHRPLPGFEHRPRVVALVTSEYEKARVAVLNPWVD